MKKDYSNIEESLGKLRKYKAGARGFRKTGKAIKQLRTLEPEAYQELVEAFPQYSGPVERYSTFGKDKKVETVLKSYEIAQMPNPLKRAIWKHPSAFIAPLVASSFISGVLSPTRPLKVYPYAAKQIAGAVFDRAPQVEQSELEDFLTSKEQVEQYREDLIEDLEDPTSEKAFMIVRNPQGELEQKPIRTIHENKNLPTFLANLFDRKHMTRLDDVIKLEEQDYEIIANGHYHVFGEVPSRGDLAIGKLTPEEDIVIVNGLVPFIFQGEKYIPYSNEKVDEDLKEEFYKTFKGEGRYRPYLRMSGKTNYTPKDFLDSLYLFISQKHIKPSITELKKDIIKLYEKYAINPKNKLNLKEDNMLRIVKEQEIILKIAQGEKLSSKKFRGIKKILKELNINGD